MRRIALLITMTAALTTQSIFAQMNHVIVLEENSSTSLTATYDGLTTGITVTPGGPDAWTVTFPMTVMFGSNNPGFFGLVDWAELPGMADSGLVNEVVFPVGQNSLAVFSDRPPANPGLLPPLPDSSITLTSVGTDSSSNPGDIFAIFSDAAGTSETTTTVPDTGTTFDLLFVSLIGLSAVRRHYRFN